MPIIDYTKHYKAPQEYLLNLYPNQLVLEKEKQEDDWIKTNMDYFYNVAVQQYTRNRKTFVRNYELIKGVIRRDDFYQDKQLQSFTETLLEQEDLPSYVKHYDIMTPAINTLTGEMSKRPDNVIIKAFDDYSKAEEMQFRTEMLQQYIIDTAQTKLAGILAAQGIQIDTPDELQQMTQKKVQEYLTDYTSMAERWGSRVIEGLKVRFNMKEKSEEAFRDFLISAREFYHIYENTSELGFAIEVLNPKNVWYLTSPDQKYISDPLDKGVGAYAAGSIEIMELSELIHKFKLTEEEIIHLRKMSQQAYLINSRESNLVSPRSTGAESVQYDVYDPLVYQYRLMAESEFKQDNRDDLNDFLGVTTNVGVFGNKYMVVRAYWCSKKKIGKLTYINEDGVEETVLIDENYKSGDHPQQLSLEWGWINQWYQGVKIGIDVYYVKPLELMDYCPIIGSIFEIKNVEPKSLVDQMKHFQMLYDVAVNRLFRLTEKDMGMVFLTSIRHIPVPKDGDHQDALEVWETEAREKGIVFIDDSPENLKAPSSFNQHTALNLSRANELQAYYNFAVEMRNECWKMVGLSEQRLGELKATETATGVNTAISQSHSQTEPWFAQHEYTLNKVYQAMLDAALYIESHKPTSNLRFLSTEGEQSFVSINGSELKGRDLWVFATSRADDVQNLREFRSLAQSMLQNGMSPYEASAMFNTKSIRKISDLLKTFEEKKQAMQQQAQQMEEQKLQQQQQIAEQQRQTEMTLSQAEQEFEAYQKQLDRISKERIAIIQATGFGKVGSEDINANTVPDVLETQRLSMESSKATTDYNIKLRELQAKEQEIMGKMQESQQKMQLEKEKIQVQRENMKNDLAVAKENAKGRSKPPKKK
jgi:hypothetical protein